MDNNLLSKPEDSKPTTVTTKAGIEITSSSSYIRVEYGDKDVYLPPNFDVNWLAFVTDWTYLKGRRDKFDEVKEKLLSIEIGDIEKCLDEESRK